MPFLRALQRPRIQPSHERIAAETDLLAQTAMRNRVARDEIVDGVPTDGAQRGNVRHVEDLGIDRQGRAQLRDPSSRNRSGLRLSDFLFHISLLALSRTSERAVVSISEDLDSSPRGKGGSADRERDVRLPSRSPHMIRRSADLPGTWSEIRPKHARDFSRQRAPRRQVSTAILPRYPRTSGCRRRSICLSRSSRLPSRPAMA